MGKITASAGARAAAMPPSEITTFNHAVRYLQDRPNVERMRSIGVDRAAFKLERTRAILDALGNPHRDIRSVHVAGTVGKGSTVAMTAAMLQGCGYAVGTYTSPHLVDIRERMTINDALMPKTEFVALTRRVAEAAANLDFEPTFFELVTALAFAYFADQAVDLAVVEVGLGGRLDCTNVITPEVCLLTRIDFDHTHLLGRTLRDIAREKAGILKPGVPAFSVEQHPDVEAVFREVADAVGCPLAFLNKEIEFSERFGASVEGRPQMRVCLFTDHSRFEHVAVPLPGEHQAGNCGLALAAVDALRHHGLKLEDPRLHAGLAATRLPGRMELVWHRPKILVDGAHNAASITTLMKSVGAHVPYDSMVCVFGCCEDKDVPTLLDCVALGGDKIIFTRAKGVPRAADPEDLQREFNERSGKMSQVAPTVPEALNLAARAVGRDDLICVTGSFYVVGETKKHLADLEKKR